MKSFVLSFFSKNNSVYIDNEPIPLVIQTNQRNFIAYKYMDGELFSSLHRLTTLNLVFARDISDLYQKVEKLLSESSYCIEGFKSIECDRLTLDSLQNGATYIDYDLYLGITPLRRGLSFGDYGIVENCTITLKFHNVIMRGGGANSSILRKYTKRHTIVFTNCFVRACEQQLLREVVPYDVRHARPQSGSMPEEGDTWYSDPGRTFDFFMRYYKSKMKSTRTLHSKEEDYIPLLLQDLGTLLYNLWIGFKNSLGLTHYSIAICNFVRCRTNSSSFKIFQDKVLPVLLSWFDETVVSFFTTKKQSLGKVIDTFGDFIQNLRDVKNSKVITHLYQIFDYLIAFNLFDGVGINIADFYPQMCIDRIKKKVQDTEPGDLILFILETLHFFLDRGYQSIMMRSWQPMFHSSSSYTKVLEDIEMSILQSKFLANPEANGFCESQYRADLDNLIERVDCMIRFGDLDKYSKTHLARYLSVLKMNKFSLCTTRAARESRKCPYSILVYGDSGIGKTTIKEILFYYYASLRKLPNDKSFCYTRNPAAKYYDGFTTSMWCIVLDDVAFMHPNAAGQGDPSVLEFLQIINNVAFVPDQAALEDKGKTPLKCDFVIATTNSEDLNAHFYFSCASAAQRRFPYIIVPKVKPEFVKEGGMLDSTKVPKLQGRFPDLWTFTIKKVVSLPATAANIGKPAKLVVEHNFECINDFLQWFGKSITEFHENQDALMASYKEMSEIQICEKCYLPVTECGCAEKQSIIVEVFWLWQCFFGGIIGRSIIYILLVWINPLIYTFLFVGCVETFLCLCKQWRRFIAYLIRKRFPGIPNWVLGYLVDPWFLRESLAESGRRTQWGLPADLERWEAVCSAASIIASFVLMYKTTRYAFFACKSATDKVEDFIFEKTGHHLGGYHQVSANQPIVNEYFFNTPESPFPNPPQTNIPQHVIDKITACVEARVRTRMQSELRECEKMGKRPEKDSNPRLNVWYNDSIELDASDLSLPSRSVTNLTDFTKIVSRNVCRLEAPCIRDGSKYIAFSSGTFVHNNYLVFNTHFLEELPEEFELNVILTVKYGLTRNCKGMLSRSQARIAGDLAVIKVTFAPPMRSLLPYLLEESTKVRNNGIYIIRRADGSLMTKEVNALQYVKVNKYCHDGYIYMGICPQQTVYGDCGSPLAVVSEAGCFILGIHAFGVDTRSEALAIDRKILENMMDTSVQSGILLELDCNTNPIKDLHYKSTLRYIEEGQARVVGSFVGFRQTPHSRVQSTPIAESLPFPVSGYKPVMEGWEPWRVALLSMTNATNHMKVGVLQKCADSFFDDVMKSVPNGLQDIHVVDIFTALNGAPGVTYIDKINRKTSAGFPWRTTKKKILKKIAPIDEVRDPVVLTDEVLDRVEHICKKYKQGVMVHPIFIAHLKDEPVSKRKLDAKKTRVFAGGPVDWSIVVRMLFLPLVKLIQENSFTFECAVGVTAQSAEWERIARYLLRKDLNTGEGDDSLKTRMVAGDYASFDKTMCAHVVLLACEFLWKLAEKSGNYSSEEIVMMKTAAHDIAYAYMDFHGDLVQFFGGNPSGNPLTVIINSIVNSIYMRYAYFELHPDHDVTDFKQNVRLITYGDDNVLSSRVDWYNHTTIARCFADVGIEYTMAEKDAASIPFITFDDITFLKRSWRFDPYLGIYKAPLEEKSIHKMLTIWVKSKTVSWQEQIVSSITSALGEAYFHGPDKFEYYYNLLSKIVREYELEPWTCTTTFSRYADYDIRFVKASKVCSPNDYQRMAQLVNLH